MSHQEKQHLLAVLGKLHLIGQRLIQTNFVLDQRAEKIPKIFSKPPENKQQEEEMTKILNESSIVGTTLLDRIIINLYNLIESHNELRPHLESKNNQHLEDSLSDAWCVINDNEELIKKLRNLIIAHGQLFGKNEITMFDDLGKEPIDVAKILYRASHCAVIYVQGIIKNFPEHHEALILLKGKVKDKSQPQFTDYLESKEYAKEIMKKTLKKLKDSSFNSDISMDVHFETL